MTLEDQISRLELKLGVKNRKIERLQHEIKNLTYQLRDVKFDYADLYKRAKAISPDNALICHLEDAITVRQQVIEEYQRHYQKYGTFYADYEKDHTPPAG